LIKALATSESSLCQRTIWEHYHGWMSFDIGAQELISSGRITTAREFGQNSTAKLWQYCWCNHLLLYNDTRKLCSMCKAASNPLVSRIVTLSKSEALHHIACPHKPHQLSSHYLYSPFQYLTASFSDVLPSRLGIPPP